MSQLPTPILCESVTSIQGSVIYHPGQSHSSSTWSVTSSGRDLHWLERGDWIILVIYGPLIKWHIAFNQNIMRMVYMEVHVVNNDLQTPTKSSHSITHVSSEQFWMYIYISLCSKKDIIFTLHYLHCRNQWKFQEWSLHKSIQK